MTVDLYLTDANGTVVEARQIGFYTDQYQPAYTLTCLPHLASALAPSLVVGTAADDQGGASGVAAAGGEVPGDSRGIESPSGPTGATPITDTDLMFDDLRALLRALGMGDHARPQSPHEVMLQCIAEVERLRDLSKAPSDWLYGRQ